MGHKQPFSLWNSILFPLVVYVRYRPITREPLVADPQTHIPLDAPCHGLSSGIWFDGSAANGSRVMGR